MSKSFFILTTHGEVGPVDRDGMRALLREGRIQRDNQVRNAFGRMHGTVGEHLARQSGSQLAATASGRRQLQSAAQASGRRPTVHANLNPRVVMASALAGLALIGGTVAFMAMSRNAAPQPTPQPASIMPTVNQPAAATRPDAAKPASTPATPLATPSVQPKPSAIAPPLSSPAAATTDQATICISVDNVWTAYLNGTKIGEGGNWQTALVAKEVPLQRGTNVLAIVAKNNQQSAGLIFDLRIGSRRLTSSAAVRVQEAVPPTNWLSVAFDDSSWAKSVVIGSYGNSIWQKNALGIPADTPAKWIWSHGGKQKENNTVHFRFSFEHPDKLAK